MMPVWVGSDRCRGPGRGQQRSTHLLQAKDVHVVLVQKVLHTAVRPGHSVTHQRDGVSGRLSKRRRPDQLDPRRLLPLRVRFSVLPIRRLGARQGGWIQSGQPHEERRDASTSRPPRDADR